MKHSRAEQARLFWESVQRCDHGEACTTCCWLWRKSTSRLGYGRTRYVLYDEQGRFIETYAHRVAWALHHGRRLGTRQGCHTCDVAQCCNPAHMWDGTPQQNHQDSVRKGRRNHGQGASNPRKLTRALVTEIWHAWQSGTSQRAIAATFRVSQPMVHYILTRKVWTWLAPPTP